MTLESPRLPDLSSDGFLAHVLDASRDAVVVMNAQQQIVAFNRAAEAVFGWPAEAVLHMPFEMLFPPRLRSSRERHFRQADAAAPYRRMGLSTVMHGQRASGQELPMEVSISQLETAGGTLFTAVVRDLSELEQLKRERREAQARLAALQAENARLQQGIDQLSARLAEQAGQGAPPRPGREDLFYALTDPAPQVMWTARPNGAVTYLNHAWLALVGGQLQDWTGWQWLAALHAEDLPAVQETWRLARASGQPFAGTRRIRAQDGSLRTMAYRAAPVRDVHGAVILWVGIDTDVSEMQRTEAALRQSNQELEAFSYAVSHDLRSPLSTINGFTSLLAKQLAGDPRDKVRHYLSRIQNGVAQMGQLIEDLLSLAQVARAPLRSAQVDLSKMARQILGEWKVRQPEREVRLEIEEGLAVQGDRRLISVAMENLLGNAWKFSTRQPWACIGVGRQLDAAGQPVFFVRDNGVGFDMAYAEKLFLPFERLHGAAEFGGMGIGLATVNRVVGRHGGRLWAESAPGRGATFYFSLPPLPPAPDA